MDLFGGLREFNVHMYLALQTVLGEKLALKQMQVWLVLVELH